MAGPVEMIKRQLSTAITVTELEVLLNETTDAALKLMNKYFRRGCKRVRKFVPGYIYCGMELLEQGLFTRASQLPGAGLGLFTRHEISKNSLIVEYKGRVTAWSDVKEAKDFNGYIFYVTRNTVIDAKRTKSALARYANDAKGIGRVKGVVNNAVYDTIGKKAYIRATKDIPAGAEILVAYGKEYWDIVKENIKEDKAKK